MAEHQKRRPAHLLTLETFSWPQRHLSIKFGLLPRDLTYQDAGDDVSVVKVCVDVLRYVYNQLLPPFYFVWSRAPPPPPTPPVVGPLLKLCFNAFLQETDAH